MLTVAELVELFASYYPHPRRAAEVIAAAGLDGPRGSPRRQALGRPAPAPVLRPRALRRSRARRPRRAHHRPRRREPAPLLGRRHRPRRAGHHGPVRHPSARGSRRARHPHRGHQPRPIVRDGTPPQVKAQAGGKTIHVRADLDPADRRGMARRGPRRANRVAPRDRGRRCRGGPGAAVQRSNPVEEVTVEERALETAFLDLVQETES